VTDTNDSILSSSDELKKWFFMNHQKRSEIFQYDDVTTHPELLAEVWKSILVSIRVLEKEEDMKVMSLL
jgi:hypothetical protein